MAECTLKLFATDLDRTLFPNGPETSDPTAADRLSSWLKESDLSVAYISGRSLDEVIQGCQDFGFPLPHFIGSDVGSRLYQRSGNSWEILSGYSRWVQSQDQDWNAELAKERLAKLPGARLQEAFRQNELKASAYVEPMDQTDALAARLQQEIRKEGLNWTLVHSLDEPAGHGLLDLLSPGADKRGALSFLQSHLGVGMEQTLFAGDSGNDLSALTSGCYGVAVRNMGSALQTHLREFPWPYPDRFYQAAGRHGECGFYASGILEALRHWGWMPS